MALLPGDIPLSSVPPKVTFLLLGVDPLAELISAVHLNNNNKNWLTALVNFMIDLVPADVVNCQLVQSHLLQLGGAKYK